MARKAREYKYKSNIMPRVGRLGARETDALSGFLTYEAYCVQMPDGPCDIRKFTPDIDAVSPEGNKNWP